MMRCNVIKPLNVFLFKIKSKHFHPRMIIENIFLPFQIEYNAKLQVFYAHNTQQISPNSKEVPFSKLYFKPKVDFVYVQTIPPKCNAKFTTTREIL